MIICISRCSYELHSICKRRVLPCHTINIAFLKNAFTVSTQIQFESRTILVVSRALSSQVDGSRVTVILTIAEVNDSDYRIYNLTASNALGQTDYQITLSPGRNPNIAHDPRTPGGKHDPRTPGGKHIVAHDLRTPGGKHIIALDPRTTW